MSKNGAMCGEELTHVVLLTEALLTRDETGPSAFCDKVQCWVEAHISWRAAAAAPLLYLTFLGRDAHVVGTRDVTVLL